METIKKWWGKIKEFFGKLSRKVIIGIIAGGAGVVVVAVVLALILNYTNYVVLFSGVHSEEASTIVAKLQEDGIPYQYQENGDILVDSAVADATRAQLVFEGYPSSGFTYDIFSTNAGGMTTDFEKRQYQLYQLQELIASTIRLFDGVADARVLLTVAEEQQYVLDDSASQNSTASVVVTMKDGGTLSAEEAVAIQRLVAMSGVPNMTIEDVAVFDGNGMEVSVMEESASSGDLADDLAKLVEQDMRNKVINVLSPFYGAENIRVSASAEINMEQAIIETTTYMTPEKIDENDKTGIVSNENTALEEVIGGDNTDGVAGTETNAEPNEAVGATDGVDSALSESAIREYLVDQIKEQREIPAGMLEDLSVSVSINSDGQSGPSQAELISLIGNATGIDLGVQEEQITVVTAPFYTGDVEEPVEDFLATMEDLTEFFEQNTLLVIIAGSILLILLILAIILLAIATKRRRKKRLAKIAEAEGLATAAAMAAAGAESVEGMENPEVFNLKNERSRELREALRSFSDENPEISAQMIRNWLNGGEDDGREPS